MIPLPKVKTTDEIEYRISLPLYYVKADIKERNKANVKLFTEDTCRQAHTIEQMARAAYTRSKTYVNYREKFIAVKIDTIQHLDKIEHAKAIAKFTAYCEKAKCKVKQMRKHLIVEVKNVD